MPCEVKSSTAFVKSPTVINKSTSAIDKSAAMIYLFQNIIVSLLLNTWVNDVHLGRKGDWLLCALAKVAIDQSDQPIATIHITADASGQELHIF